MSTASGVSIIAGVCSALSVSASWISGLGPSVVPATSTLRIPATPRPSLAIPATSTSGAPAIPWQASALLQPPRHPPDHGTCTLAVSIPQASDLQAPLTRGCYEVTTADSLNPLEVPRLPDHGTLTRGCKDDSPAYNKSMLDIYRVVTACGQPNFRGARIPLTSNFDFHQWSVITHTQADAEVLWYLKYGFPAGFEGPIPTSDSMSLIIIIIYIKLIKKTGVHPELMLQRHQLIVMTIKKLSLYHYPLKSFIQTS